jgi:hypothetical protein
MTHINQQEPSDRLQTQTQTPTQNRAQSRDENADLYRELRPSPQVLEDLGRATESYIFAQGFRVDIDHWRLGNILLDAFVAAEEDAVADFVMSVFALRAAKSILDSEVGGYG